MGFVATQLRRWGPSISGLILMIVGLGGAPDDLRVWGNWVGDFVGSDGFRLLLVAVGIAIIAIANVPGLRRLATAAWHIMGGADPSPTKPASANLAPAEKLVEIRRAFIKNNFVHLEVTNSGSTDDFIAQVTSVEEGLGRDHTVPWSVKWRDVNTEQRVIPKGGNALLDLAEFTLPEVDLAKAEEDDMRMNVDPKWFSPPSFRFYSVSQPQGFDAVMERVSFPIDLERTQVILEVRVSGTRTEVSDKKEVRVAFRPTITKADRLEYKGEVKLYKNGADPKLVL